MVYRGDLHNISLFLLLVACLFPLRIFIQESCRLHSRARVSIDMVCPRVFRVLLFLLFLALPHVICHNEEWYLIPDDQVQRDHGSGEYLVLRGCWFAIFLLLSWIVEWSSRLLISDVDRESQDLGCFFLSNPFFRVLRHHDRDLREIE